MNFKKSKKGFVADVIIASAALIAVVLVIALAIMILVNFNSEIQKHTNIQEEAKEASAYAEGTFPGILGWGFLAIFIGFFLYTIITAALINNIHPIFWIMGFVMIFMSTIVSSSFKLAYGFLQTSDLIAPYIAFIPGATWYFTGMEIINVVWMGIQLTIIYFTWER